MASARVARAQVEWYCVHSGLATPANIHAKHHDKPSYCNRAQLSGVVALLRQLQAVVAPLHVHAWYKARLVEAAVPALQPHEQLDARVVAIVDGAGPFLAQVQTAADPLALRDFCTDWTKVVVYLCCSGVVSRLKERVVTGRRWR